MKVPEIHLVPEPRTSEARDALGFKFAEGNVGRRHKIGGEPDWIQTPEVPTCEECQKGMDFYGQLDSIGDDVCLADCGIVYVFVCHDCFTTTSVLQSS